MGEFDNIPIKDLTINDKPLKEGLTKMAKLTLITPVEQPNVELGIDAVLSVVDCGAEFKEAYDIATSDDGTVSFSDVLKHPMEIIYEPIKAAFKIFSEKNLIIPQALDIDYMEAEEILTRVEEKFGVDEGVAKIIIENSFKALYHIKEVIKAF